MPVPASARLTVVTYLRVSTEEQARKGYSLSEQRDACQRKARQIATEHGQTTGQPVDLEIVEFIDDFGGDIAERPVLEQVRAYVRSRRPAWLVCMDPDRFSRSLKLQLIVADDIEAQQTRLAFVQQEYDPADLMSRAFFQFRGLMSELDKAKILERTSRGKRGKVKAGRRPNGAAPYGYRHCKETDSLEIYEPEAQWVRQIFAWVVHEQMGIHMVARRLNELGVPRKRSGTRWYRSVVGDLIRNATYYGEMRCNRKDFTGLGAIRRLPRHSRKPLSPRIRPESEWVAVPVPAIIPREQWELAQATLRSRTRRGGRRETGLLSMLVRCGECGGSMSYARHSRGRRYLRCQRRYAHLLDYKAGTSRCTNRHHRAEQVEELVWGQLAGWLTDPALIEVWLEEHPPAPDRAAVVARLQAEQGALQERLEAEYRVQAATVRRQAQGQLADPVVEAMLGESAKHIREIEARLATIRQRLALVQANVERAEGTPSRSRFAPEQVLSEAAETRRQLAALDAAQRRELVVRVIKSVTLHPGGGVTVTLLEV